MKIILSLFFCILLTGCAAIIRDAPDISFNKVTYVEKKELYLLYGSYKTVHIIRDEKMRYYLIELESRSNLFDFEESNGLSFSPVFNFCDKNEKVSSMGLLGIYPKDVTDNNFENGEALSHISNSFVVIANASTSEYAPTSSIQFDLTKSPNDICLSLRGSSMAFTFETNKVRVNSEQLEEARKRRTTDTIVDTHNFIDANPLYR
ncbi:hypothetical protein [Marinomonas mediterranea]|uniref:hypothetical protein n=1 Tax=Marinomonas mediterranea TaxID=119864 RepID=UPI0023492AC6|nr:hypothetical protein [Marinomonas mediterranea]WCN10214.1 hypothetical protein GV055_15500 [Marinomonas mediterranea]